MQAEFQVKSGGFHVDFTCEIQWISCKICRISCEIHLQEPYKSKISRKTLKLHGVQWEGYVRWISHEIRNERPTICQEW